MHRSLQSKLFRGGGPLRRTTIVSIRSYTTTTPTPYSIKMPSLSPKGPPTEPSTALEEEAKIRALWGLTECASMNASPAIDVVKAKEEEEELRIRALWGLEEHTATNTPQTIDAADAKEEEELWCEYSDLPSPRAYMKCETGGTEPSTAEQTRHAASPTVQRRELAEPTAITADMAALENFFLHEEYYPTETALTIAESEARAAVTSAKAAAESTATERFLFGEEEYEIISNHVAKASRAEQPVWLPN